MGKDLRLTPCWECLKAEIEENYDAIKTDSEDPYPVRWTKYSCTFDGLKCDTCIRDQDKCTRVPVIVEGNAIDFLQTIEFINDLCDQKHPTTKAARLCRQTRQDLVKCLAKLASWLKKVVSIHTKQYGLDYFEALDRRVWLSFSLFTRGRFSNGIYPESVREAQRSHRRSPSTAGIYLKKGTRKSILTMIPIKCATPVKSWTSQDIREVLDGASLPDSFDESSDS
ncbi:hypothetical protein FDECE_7360 [Fusarium decemcellulare]|nr:hypothetical protein FDECE_7360 [Fusarium decemcellulare]